MNTTEKHIDSLYNIITARCDNMEFEKRAFEKRANGKGKGLTGATIGALSELALKWAPLMAFSVPFLGGSVLQIAQKELKEQEIEHTKRLSKLREQFQDVYEEGEENDDE